MEVSSLRQCAKGGASNLWGVRGSLPRRPYAQIFFLRGEISGNLVSASADRRGDLLNNINACVLSCGAWQLAQGYLFSGALPPGGSKVFLLRSRTGGPCRLFQREIGENIFCRAANPFAAQEGNSALKKMSRNSGWGGRRSPFLRGLR